MSKPDIGYGRHNRFLPQSISRLQQGHTYRDLSTVIVVPTRGEGLSLTPKWVGAMAALMRPMNQKVLGPLFFTGFEVADAYNAAFQAILAHPELSTWRYILTYEDDVIPPPDGLLKLYESLEGGVDGRKYDCMQALYWTKGDGGQPMIYGDPAVLPKNFIPQVPRQDTVQPANGLGMGFNLWRLSMFTSGKLEKPWFRTLQEHIPNQGTRTFTQDLYFFDKAGGHGFRFACDTRVKAGHYDWQGGVVW